MKQTLLYSLKIWLTTIILSVLLLSIVNPYKVDCFYCDPKEYLWASLGALMSFLPLLLLIILIVKIDGKKNFKFGYGKLPLEFTIVILTIIYTLIIESLFFLTGQISFDLHTILFMFAFPIMMGVSIWFYKMKTRVGRDLQSTIQKQSDL